MIEVVKLLEEKFQEVLDWVHNEIHGNVADEAKQVVTDVVQRGKDQAAAIAKQVSVDVSDDIAAAEADVHQATAPKESTPDVPNQGDGASS